MTFCSVCGLHCAPTTVDVTFHKVPKNNGAFDPKWVEILTQLGKKVTVNTVVCSNHFTKNCFVNFISSANNTKKTKLKKGSIPTILPQSSTVKTFSYRQQENIEVIYQNKSVATQSTNLRNYHEKKAIENHSSSSTNCDLDLIEVSPTSPSNSLQKNVSIEPYKAGTAAASRFMCKADLHLLNDNIKTPHKCNLCHKTFVHNNELENHMNSHVGERFFKCKHCEKAFFKKENIILHLKNHFPDKSKVKGRQTSALTQIKEYDSHFKTLRLVEIKTKSISKKVKNVNSVISINNGYHNSISNMYKNAIQNSQLEDPSSECYENKLNNKIINKSNLHIKKQDDKLSSNYFDNKLKSKKNPVKEIEDSVSVVHSISSASSNKSFDELNSSHELEDDDCIIDESYPDFYFPYNESPKRISPDIDIFDEEPVSTASVTETLNELPNLSKCLLSFNVVK